MRNTDDTSGVWLGSYRHSCDWYKFKETVLYKNVACFKLFVSDASALMEMMFDINHDPTAAP